LDETDEVGAHLFQVVGGNPVLEVVRPQSSRQHRTPATIPAAADSTTTWKGLMIQLLGWIGSALIVLSLTLRRQLPFRLVNLMSAGVLLVFNLAIGLWSMILLNTAIMIVNLYQLRRMHIRRGPHPETGRTGLVHAPPAEG
jgi:hypothetical protein